MEVYDEIEFKDMMYQWLEEDGSCTTIAEVPPARYWIEYILDDDSRIIPNLDFAIWVSSYGSITTMLMQILDQLELLKIIDGNEEYEDESDIDYLKQKMSASLVGKRVFFVFDSITCKDNLLEIEALGVLQNRSFKCLLIGDENISDDLLGTYRVHYFKACPEFEMLFFYGHLHITPRHVFGFPDVSALVKAVVKDCQGVMFEILILAFSFRDLRGDASHALITKHLEQIIALRTEFSRDFKGICYEMLPSKAMKECFLYCYTEYQVYHRINRQELIRSWIREGFLRGLDDFEKAIDEGNRMLNELLDRRLLGTRSGDYVKLQSDVSSFQQYPGRKGLVKASPRWDFNLQLENKTTDKKSESEDVEGLFQYFLKLAPRGDPPFVQSSSLTAAKKVLEWLNYADVGFIEIEGKLGMGSTWATTDLVKKVKKSNLFEKVILVEVSLKHYDRGKMLRQIVDQLNLNSIREENNKDEKESQSLLKQTIFEYLRRKTFFLILHDVRMFFSTDLNELGVPRPSLRNNSKVLITGREYNIDNENVNRVLSLVPLPFHEAWYLFCEKAGMYFISPDLRPLAETLVKDCGAGPLDIIILGGSFRNLKDGDTSPKLITKHLERVIELRKAFTFKKICFEMLPSTTHKDCFLYCTNYIEYDSINVKGLITSWIMEGFLDGFNCLEEAYTEGRRILKELVDCYLLSRSDENHVTMHESLRDREEYILVKGSYEIITTPEIFMEDERINLMDGDLKTKYSDSPDHSKPSHLLLYGDGGVSPGEITDAFFQKMQDLEVITILHAGIKSLPSSLSNVHKLRVLVLRGCGSFQKVSHIEILQNLEVLSISGTSAMKEIPDNFFNHMTKLKTLNLSGTEIEHLPSSLSNIWRLEFLILRDCSNLKALPMLKELCSLIVLDLSDCIAFKGFQDESFGLKCDLHTLDLSRTQVAKLPFLSKCINLRHLLLRDCVHLEKLPDLKELAHLSVHDFSGCTGLKDRFYDVGRLFARGAGPNPLWPLCYTDVESAEHAMLRSGDFGTLLIHWLWTALLTPFPPDS
ncbi:hypothetical protein GIB67_034124 [Kingdonia uniflora]|uniref:NB-ARC domain-containing protein n=1 Tax=Kingdonia uniflora TaxID=39325 RepID=A0A7J7ME52_9MAGN|nr:hypothetical protein GIB67_034124 [Kingdonia uniflora]